MLNNNLLKRLILVCVLVVSACGSIPSQVSTLTATSLPDVYLSELTPVYVAVGYGHLGVGKYDLPEENVNGKPIYTHGEYYPHGLMAHAPSRLDYQLNGQYRFFHTQILKQDDVDCGDGVIFMVLVDGKNVYTSGVVSSSGPPQNLELNVANAQRLSLVVDERQTGDCDWSIWGDPLLSQTKGATPTVPTNTSTLAAATSVMPTAVPSSTSTSIPTTIPSSTPTALPLPTPNPALGPLQIVGQIGGPTQAVAVADNYAFVGVGSRLTVLDISTPSSPRELGSSEPFSAAVRDVEVFGNTAFVAAGGAGLYIVDISDPAHPTTLGNYKSSGYTEGVTAAGKYAYVADGPDGLRIVDITDRAHPVEVSSVYPMSYAFDVVVDGSYAYIAAAGAGLLVADISDPAHPKAVGSYGLYGYAYGLAKSGPTIYIADGWEGLQVLDVSDPTKPQSIGSYSTPGWAMDVITVGDTLYLADASDGLRVFNISDKSKIAEIGNYSTPDGHSGHLAVHGNTVYLADIHLGVHIVDVSVPSNPQRVGLYSPMGHAQAVAVANGHAYIAGLTYGLRVIDLADITHPREVASLATELPATTIATSGNSVYMGTFIDMKSNLPPSLYAVDVSDPLHPKASSPQPLEGHTGLSTFQGGNPPSGNIIGIMPHNIFVQGTNLYISGEWGFLTLDISDPLSPHELSFLQTAESTVIGLPTTGFVTAVGNVAYVAVMWGGLYTFDVSNPKQPTLLGVFNDPPPGVKNPKDDPVSSVAVAPPFAYILYNDMVRVLDISDPRHPKGLGSFPVPLPPFTNGIGAQSLAVDGNRLFIADNAAGLLELDVTDPNHLKLIGQLRMPGLATWVTVDKGLVYVADGDGGLFIIQTSQESATINNAPIAHQDWPENRPYNSPPFENSSLTASLVPSPDGIANVDQTIADQYQPVSFQRSLLLFNLPALPQSSGNTCTVTSTGDSGSGTLRECMQKAQSGEVINFDPQVFPPKNPSTIYVMSDLGLGGGGRVTIDGSHAGVILDGSHAPKGTNGLNILSDNNVIKGLQILYFPSDGIVLQRQHNIIGGDRSRGEAPIGEGNVISGNGEAEIGTKVAAYNLIIGNYIGIDVTGKKSLGKPSFRTIDIAGSSSHNRIEKNVIFGAVGIGDQGSSYNEIVGNFIGTDASGTIPLGDDSVIVVGLPFNRIGGTRSGEGNVINGRIAILGTSDVVVMGNSIGIDSTGKKTFPLSTWALSLGNGTYHNFIGGTTDGERNVIAGGKDSILVHLDSIADFNFIAGNYLGVDASGKIMFPNQVGISLETSEHNAIQGNLIAGGQAFGVSLSSLDLNQASANFNWIRANRITQNKVGLGIGNGVGNTIVGNSFVGNSLNGQDGGQNDLWNDESAGNYWSDYRGKDANGDGIGDTPYKILPNGVDRYPLMKPFP